MIRLVLIVGVLSIGLRGFGQNDFFFSHYMFNPSYYNPSWVGQNQSADLFAHHRSQWVGYQSTVDPGGPPNTQMVSLTIPTQLWELTGVGVSVVNDNLPSLNSVQVRFAAAFKKDLSRGQMLLGIAPSVNILTQDPGDFRPVDPEDFGVKESIYQPNLHASLMYQSTADYFIGLSVENILQPTFAFVENLNSEYFPMAYNLFAGTSFPIARDFSISPTLLMRSDSRSLSFDLSAILTYNQSMWGGVTFRKSESIILLLGYSFLDDNKMSLGYSFDYVVVEQEAKQPTSHEIMIKYKLPNLVLGGKKVIKTPRFVF